MADENGVTADSPTRKERHVLATQAGYTAGREEGIGTLENISHTGALLRNTTSKPAIGTVLQLYVLREDLPAVELEARVARHSAQGFAVQFVSFTKELGELIEALAKSGPASAAG